MKLNGKHKRFKQTVLIVDDDAVNGLVLENFFEEFHTTTKQKAEDALATMKKEVFDVVLMDIHLSNENYSGIVLMKEMREDPRYKNVKFIAVTGYAMAQDEQAILNAGFDAYFTKPLEKETILPKVKELLNIPA